MARTSQTQRNYAIAEAKKIVVAAIAAVQVADRNIRLAEEKENKPTFGDLQNALRAGKITLPAGIDLTQTAHTNYHRMKDPLEVWITANSKKSEPETSTSFYKSVPYSFATSTNNWPDVESGQYLSSDDRYYHKQANLDKVKKLLAAFDFTQRAIMLGDSDAMNLALTELAERISSI